ncbi:hypothetical protein P4S73_12975 [Paraglaciecola sp. Hal342]|uniref:Lipoprotein n=2 Tax=Paraglaciecola chathamensis TaxID=368405 RepID=A0ABS0WFE5_9ALTE|nr:MULTISPECIES: hypothetical protein [Paraglaciecola]MBJ2137173.1 hypothetical protein [Paraglaciecola chathamensis]MDO6559544.1 hypothetical protein [Paraglaciecola chathamensis]GAC05288.1 hypothetical protein GAGA_2437 [Paraglaciecola agarilytica NO2]
MKNQMLVVVSALVTLSACTTPYGYHDPAPDTCDGAPGCAVSAIYSGVIKTKPKEGQKCGEMSGEQKRECFAQVDAIKRAIDNAKRNK